ncbi:LOG family protein [Thiogranum longum]|jgi:uncharacterized protein (TIGR00730 family)
MKDLDISETVFPTAEEDAGAAKRVPDTPQTRSPSYRLAYADKDFLLREELRPVRLQLELLKPELLQQEHGIEATIVIFGSTRIPEADKAAEDLRQAEEKLGQQPEDPELILAVRIARSIVTKVRYYDEARKLANLITRQSEDAGLGKMVVITGGGPGIMEAANRGAWDAGGESIGLNIVLPREQCPNRYITPELNFQFHYFAVRKMHFLMRAKALIAFPGGFGTLDELFETLTLIQTRKVKTVPVLLFGKEYWQKVINFEALVSEGTIDPADVRLFRYVETAEQAWAAITGFYQPTS